MRPAGALTVWVSLAGKFRKRERRGLGGPVWRVLVHSMLWQRKDSGPGVRKLCPHVGCRFENLECAALPTVCRQARILTAVTLFWGLGVFFFPFFHF